MKNSVLHPEANIKIYKKLSFLYGICFNLAIEGKFFLLFFVVKHKSPLRLMRSYSFIQLGIVAFV
jgi:hypothetical protein